MNVNIKVRSIPITKELPLWITAYGSAETFEYAGRSVVNLIDGYAKVIT